MSTLVEEKGIRVIDCDTHVVEPYDLWTSRVAKKWQDLVPRVIWSEEHQQDVWTMPGEPVVAAAAAAAHAGWSEYAPDRPPRLSDAVPATWDARQRLQLMDQYGIYGQVLYPNVAGFGGGRYTNLPDNELRLDCVRAYNNWLTEWASIAPDRFIPICSIPFWDVGASVAELERCRGMGHRGFVFSSHPNKHGQPYLADPHWNRLWSAAQDLQMPVNFHIGSAGLDDFEATNFPPNGRHINHAIMTTLLFFSNASAIVDAIFSGICERFPSLKFVSVESGVGWLPFQLEAMDWQWQNHGLHLRHPDRLLPSEYFKRQFYACFWFERGTIGPTLDALGADCVLFETDFPHPTSQSPGPASTAVPANQYIDEALRGLPDEAIRKILHDNAAALYRLD